MKNHRVAIIGAGISGAAAARLLTDSGCSVTVFEKSRGVGGRMSTRRLDFGTSFDHASFDHGAQYFTVRSQAFSELVSPLIEQGLVAAWPNPEQRIVSFEQGQCKTVSDAVKRFVAVPGMNQLCKSLLEGIDVQRSTRIISVENNSRHWKLNCANEKAFDGCDALICSAPSAQTAELLAGHSEVSQFADRHPMRPCWAAMILFDGALETPFAGAFLNDPMLSWAAMNSTKPGRRNETQIPSIARDSLLLHAQPQWTQQNWDGDSNTIAGEMLQEFWSITGLKAVKPSYMDAHRWKYAIPAPSDSTSSVETRVGSLGGAQPISLLEVGECGWDAANRVAVCGDWCNGGRVEGAYLSGLAAAKKILAQT